MVGLLHALRATLSRCRERCVHGPAAWVRSRVGEGPARPRSSRSTSRETPILRKAIPCPSAPSGYGLSTGRGGSDRVPRCAGRRRPVHCRDGVGVEHRPVVPPAGRGTRLPGRHPGRWTNVPSPGITGTTNHPIPLISATLDAILESTGATGRLNCTRMPAAPTIRAECDGLWGQ